ncbi:MAG: hypothetical protein LIP23_07930 [Planctomycetes bacterium]|nr:hypothetical protein [Planctomycetota bacterium]
MTGTRFRVSMAKSEETALFDDLDAFFSAAENADASALEKAAVSVSRQPVKPPRQSTGQTPRQPAAQPSSQPAASPSLPQPDAAAATADRSGNRDEAEFVDAAIAPIPVPTPGQFIAKPPSSRADLAGKFIAIDPETIETSSRRQEPFVLTPAHVHAFLPWWVWLTIALALVVLICGIMVMPQISLDRITARLGGHSPSNVQGAMRHLVLKGDERTIDKLYSIAASNTNEVDLRLRAVDTLGLMEETNAERALLRLELSSGTDARVRAAAINARKQRETARTRQNR